MYPALFLSYKMGEFVFRFTNVAHFLFRYFLAVMTRKKGISMGLRLNLKRIDLLRRITHLSMQTFRFNSFADAIPGFPGILQLFYQAQLQGNFDQAHGIFHIQLLQ